MNCLYILIFLGDIKGQTFKSRRALYLAQMMFYKLFKIAGLIFVFLLISLIHMIHTYLFVWS